MAAKIEGEKAEVKKLNHVSVADFDVISSEASLREVEETMDRIINKHKEFAEFRRKKVILEHNGMVG
jgi:hypothetical protein